MRERPSCSWHMLLIERVATIAAKNDLHSIAKSPHAHTVDNTGQFLWLDDWDSTG